MVFTDHGHSQIRDWLINLPIAQPSGMLMGLGSTDPIFGDLKLGSAVDATREWFSSTDKVGRRAIFEYIVQSGDFTAGSDFREIGLINQSGGNLWFREKTYAITMAGSTEIQSILNIDVI